MTKRLRRAVVGFLAAAAAVTGLTVGTAGSASAGTAGEHLYKGETLWGYGNQYIGRWQSNYVWTLVMQSDGNLVEYRTDPLGYGRRVCWSTNTWGNGYSHAVYQSDGNFVVYTDGGRVLWASNTVGVRGSSVDIDSLGAIWVGTKKYTGNC